MSDFPKPKIGTIVWQDLTVENADQIKQFYSDVVGWKSSPFNMGSYDDFNMIGPHNGETVSGICHARGGLPPQWLIYISIADMQTSIKRCIESGDRIVDGPGPVGNGEMCVIQDPSEAFAALITK